MNGHSEKKSTVENTARRLTEMSRKEDCDVIHNLIMTVQDRFKKLQQRVSERGRKLEEAKKGAKQVHTATSAAIKMDDLQQLSQTKHAVLYNISWLLIFQFNESWRLLLDWMTEVEQTLDTHKEIAVSHEEIKQQLTEQKVQ